MTALAVMTNVAIFGCNHADLKEIQTPGTKCYRIMALGAPAEWLYALTTVSWSLTIAFDIYTTPIVSKVKSAQDQAELEQLASKQYKEWSTSQHSPESSDYHTPGQDEGTDSSRSSLDDIEYDKRRNGLYNILDKKSSQRHDHNEYSCKDENDAYDLGQPMRTREWT
jgi:hypothetical protein